MRFLQTVAAALAALAAARPLSDAEQAALYGYKFVDGPTRPLTVSSGEGASDTLRGAADAAGVFMGTAANYAGMTGNDANYKKIALQEFNLATAENECKWPSQEPQRGTFTFTQCDYLLNQWKATNGSFRMHNTCWGSQNPQWLNGGGFNAATLTTILQTHITTVMNHYKTANLAYVGLDVVNEAVSDSGNAILKNVQPWYPTLTNYIDIAFTAARAADPTKKLFYNEYGAEGFGSAKCTKVKSLVSTMKTNNVPIDGVGLQMHISIDSHPTPASIAQNIADLGTLGLEVHITEMDVKCPAPCNAQRLAAQAQLYGDVLLACLNNTNCKSFETWGFTDKDTWIGTGQHPLLFDENYAKKPAYTEVLAVLNAHAKAKRSTDADGSVHLRGSSNVPSVHISLPKV